MAFDYGVPEEDLTSHIGKNLKLWPTEGDFTLLLDADSIPYVVGYTSDHVQYLRAKNDPLGFENSQVFLDKCDHANFLLNEWVRKAKADSCILFVTDSKTNFRLKLMPDYKSKRTDEETAKEKPPFFYEIKQWLIDYHGARLSNGREADDDVSIESWERILAQKAEGVELWSNMHKTWCNYIIGSADKDLGMIPCWHVDQNTGERYWVEGVGVLKPVWKEKEITDYEYHPLFNGKPVSLDGLVAIPRSLSGGLTHKTREQACQISREHLGDKWSLDYTWIMPVGSSSLTQDRFTRGDKKGQGKFKRVKAGMKKSEYIDNLKGIGLSFFYAQVLMGDPTDGYKGLDGVGVTSAYEILKDKTTEWELYQAVLGEYKKVHDTEEAAIEALTLQGRMAWMCTKPDELWTPPTSSDDSSYPA